MKRKSEERPSMNGTRLAGDQESNMRRFSVLGIPEVLRLGGGVCANSQASTVCSNKRIIGEDGSGKNHENLL